MTAPIKISLRWVRINLVGSLLVAAGIGMQQGDAWLRWTGLVVIVLGVLLAGFALWKILQRAQQR